MRSISVALFAFIFSAIAARAEWTVVATRSEFSANRLAEHRHVELEEAGTGQRATLELALFSNKSATLRVLDDPAANGELASMMQREKCIAGVNGGYFDPNYAPVGLLISDGRVIAPMRKARLLSGVVSVVNGRVAIQRPPEFSLKAKPTNARQCGPFLVNGGKAIAGLNATREARRTFVASNGGERAAIGYCSYVTLAQLADSLTASEIAPDFKIQRALNLDGGSSSGFWFAGENGAFSVREQKTVRDYLAVVSKAPRP